MVAPERRQAVKSLLQGALQCEPAARALYIHEAAGGDSALSDAALDVLREIESKFLESDGSSSEEELLDDAFRDESETTTVIPVAHLLREFSGTERFDVRRRLGSGGFGTVYECYDRLQHHVVALKVLRRSDPAFLYRFKREFRALVDIRHDNLVELYELFGEGEHWFFTMELVRGVDFLSYVAGRDRDAYATGRVVCNVDRLRAAARGLADGIMALHRRGMLHRDIKPGNVLVSSDGRVRLLDFGLVREIDLNPTQSVMVVGTPAYMAPEQLSRQPSDASADWYSFGVMLFQALTGSMPARNPLAAIDRHLRNPPQTVPGDAPADLAELCLELLRDTPSARPSGAEILRRLGSTEKAARGRAATDPDEEQLVGRESHLQRLSALVGATREGRPIFVNLSGKSGIGKSSLLRAFRRRMSRTDGSVVVLTGRCHENELVPYKALDDLIDGLSHYLNALPDAEADALVPRDGQCVVRMFPVLAQVQAIARLRRHSVDVADAQELRQRAFASLQDLLARLTERHTVVVAIDDLQWGDQDSAVVLRALFAGPCPPAVLFIASYRSDDALASPLLQDWHSYLRDAKFVVHDIELAELTADQSAAMATRLLGSAEPVAMMAEAIAREAGGSPFLIEQLARHQALTTVDPQYLTIQRVVGDQLDALPPRHRRLLETLAIAAQPLPETTACAAAEFESNDRAALLMLAASHFVRFREVTGARQVEIYHARLGDMILESMSPEHRRRCHFNLALALETAVEVDAAAVAIHCQEAGDRQRAAKYALVAGHQSLNALAFDRAIQFYQLAVEYGDWPSDELAALRRKLAISLTYAGRGAQAAEVYLAAAEAAETERAELQRLAAEQLLRSGHLAQGLAVLEGIARDLGIWLAPRRWQTAISVAWHRSASVYYVRRFHDDNTREMATNDAMVLDVYWSFLIGLILLDPIRAMDFHTRHLLHAARTGDRRRFALSLAIEAAGRAAMGWGDSRAIDELMARARGLCAAGWFPETLGLIATAEAMCACMAQDWQRGLRLSREAQRFLAEQCSGVAWERATARELECTAAFQLGEWRVMSDYAQRPAYLDDARSRGDVHALVASIPGGTLPFLTADRPAQADAFVRDTISTLPGDRFLMPHLWALNLQVYSALYQGDGPGAWQLVHAQWRAVTRSLFLRLPYVAVIAYDCRARAAIAAAATATRAEGEPYVNEALRVAKTLSRMPSPWARAMATLTHANAASVQGEKALALTRLEQAEGEFGAIDMAQYVAACRHRRGLLAGQIEGPRLIADAERWAQGQGVVSPSKVFDMLAPGRWA